MNDIQRLDPSRLYSNAVIHNNTVHLVAIAQDYSAGIEQQTREALADIEAALARVGSNKSRLLCVQIWLRDLAADFEGMNTVWAAWLPEGCAPARATCQVVMADPDMRIEIIVTAAA